MNISYIDNFINVKNNTFEQRRYLKWERRYIVGEMSEANFLFIMNL